MLTQKTDGSVALVSGFGAESRHEEGHKKNKENGLPNG